MDILHLHILRISIVALIIIVIMIHCAYHFHLKLGVDVSWNMIIAIIMEDLSLDRSSGIPLCLGSR